MTMTRRHFLLALAATGVSAVVFWYTSNRGGECISGNQSAEDYCRGDYVNIDGWWLSRSEAPPNK